MEGGVVEGKIKVGGERDACCSSSPCYNDQRWTAHTLLIKRWEQLPSASFPPGLLWLATCQIEPFILLFWLGLHHWKGKRKEDCGGTLGMRIN